MNVNLKKLNHIRQSTKDTVFGYIRKLRKLLPQNNAYYDMPINIQNDILFFYYHGITFNTKYQSDLFIFTNDNTTVEPNTASAYGYLTCFLDDEITDCDCNIFNLYIKWLKGGDHFLMGYITSTIKEFDSSKSTWLGYKSNNKNTGYGICLGLNSKHMWLYDKDEWCKELKPSNSEYKIGDTFMLSFDFVNNKLIIYHNKHIVDTLSLHNAKKIIPGLTIDRNVIQIVKCEFLN